MDERRSEHRMKVLKQGKIVFADRVTLDCTVRDISSAGARLEFEGPVALPGEFRLCLVSADLTIPATCVWQRRLEAGIRFVGVGTAGPVDSSPARSAA